MISPGESAPEFTLRREDGNAFTPEDLKGKTTVLVFYPFAFSPVCTDQFNLYEEVLDDFKARGATLYGVSCDATWSQKAFREKLGVTIEQLSDFEPKGEACRAFGVYHPGGFPQRALLIIGPDGVVKWGYEAEVPTRAARRQPDLRRSRCRRRGLTELGSAPVPAPSPEDHIAGPDDAPLVIEYADFECPYCAAQHLRISRLRLRRVFRHFPVRSSHPRAWAAACAAEAAALQGRFWEMHELLFADQGRLEDPHLWERARELGLDLERFDADRRSDAVGDRVRRDFQSGVRAGVVTTPSLFYEGRLYAGQLDAGAMSALEGSAGPA